MATAVKNSAETTTAPDHRAGLLRASLLGAVYVVACLAIVFLGIPYAWKAVLSNWMASNNWGIFDPVGMALAMIVAGVGLLVGGLYLAGSHPPPGLRAGVFTFVALGFAVFFATIWIARFIRGQFLADNTAKLGLVLMIAVGVALIFAIVKFLVLRPDFGSFLTTFESQGWFGIRSYKRTQGLLVRRLTMAGIITVVATGIWSMEQNRTENSDWKVAIPYTDGLISPGHHLVATLLPDTRFTLPVLFVALGGWFAWRAVNYPVFADFLIATEAELNKVSWVTRKRLIQDTIVVLVTLVLFTIFLLVVDQLWGWLLTRESLPWGSIVPKPKPAKVEEATREKPW